jgi:primosomal protein N' (replication factor Y)
MNHAEFYADVLLPLYVRGPYTYLVPEALVEECSFGIRVEVPFGKTRHYAGLVIRIHREAPLAGHVLKEIIDVIDEQPVINENTWKFWEWMANYYMCTTGEVMRAALPAYLRLESTTILVPGKTTIAWETLEHDDMAMILEGLEIRGSLSIEDVQKISGRKNVMPLIKKLIEMGGVQLREELEQEYTPRPVYFVSLEESYRSHPEAMRPAYEMVKRSKKQTDLLLAFSELSRDGKDVQPVKDLTGRSGTELGDIRKMVQKGIFILHEGPLYALQQSKSMLDVKSPVLDDAQLIALERIKTSWKEHKPLLLHGVTGSGKTHVYAALIREQIASGKQVLYLVPEIALTTQLTHRLEELCGSPLFLYHSKVSVRARSEAWKAALGGVAGLYLSARSGIFLPLQQCGAIIVDEEHDASYKQSDPAPRYHGRDCALWLGQLWSSGVLLGSATPSCESYYHASAGKYGLARLITRYANSSMPHVYMVNYRDFAPNAPHMSITARNALQKALDGGGQAIILRNRRGYAPVLACRQCGWVQKCQNCDIHLSWHEFIRKLRCHHCNYSIPMPPKCPDCGHAPLALEGFGTEKVEEEVASFFPEVKIARMDSDATPGVKDMSRVIDAFSMLEYQVLIGTQMISKGLDFTHVDCVIILAADASLLHPDFRASERTWQLIQQVGGRAGRAGRPAEVLIQARWEHHPVLKEILENDMTGFYQRELTERKQYRYPPFCRMMHWRFLHQDKKVAITAAQYFAQGFKMFPALIIQGPVEPLPGWVRNLHLQDVWIKIPLHKGLLQEVRLQMHLLKDLLAARKDMKNLRIRIDVDPM